MKLNRNLIQASLGGLLLLVSHQGISAATRLNVKYINVPAFNLITDTLAGMSSSVDGKRNDDVMQLICDLARGEKTQQEVNTILEQSHVDIETIPEKGSISSLLINHDQPGRAATCAAYIASSLFYATDNALLFDKTKNKSGADEPVLNQKHFNADAKLKMSLAQATANFYAVIAGNLKSDINTPFKDYQNDVISIVYDYAPEYLRLVQEIYSTNHATYTPLVVNTSVMDVVDNFGRELHLSPQGVVMKSRGVTWLGEGKILGKEYFLTMKVINSATKSKVKTRGKANQPLKVASPAGGVQ